MVFNWNTWCVFFKLKCIFLADHSSNFLTSHARACCTCLSLCGAWLQHVYLCERERRKEIKCLCEGLCVYVCVRAHVYASVFVYWHVFVYSLWVCLQACMCGLMLVSSACAASTINCFSQNLLQARWNKDVEELSENWRGGWRGCSVLIHEPTGEAETGEWNHQQLLLKKFDLLQTTCASLAASSVISSFLSLFLSSIFAFLSHFFSISLRDDLYGAETSEVI